MITVLQKTNQIGALGQNRNLFKNNGWCFQGENVTWYHEGPDALKEARMWIAKYSLARFVL